VKQGAFFCAASNALGAAQGDFIIFPPLAIIAAAPVASLLLGIVTRGKSDENGSKCRPSAQKRVASQTRFPGIFGKIPLPSRPKP